MNRSVLRRLATALLLCSPVIGCSSWLGDNAPPPLPGKRISVLTHSRSLEPSSTAEPDITLPAPEAVADWPQAGGYPPHAMHHLALGDSPRRVWSTSVGEGGSRRRVFLTQPIVADGVVFAMDARSRVSAITLDKGDRLWRQDLAPKDSGDGTYGGGLAYDSGTLFVTSGFGQIIALDAKTGEEMWRRPLPAPVRGAPTVRGGRILLITVDNQTLALSTEDGRDLWTHSGLSEMAAMVGGTSPAVDGNTVISAYTSGEVFALRIENGTTVWSDVLAGIKRTDQVGTMTDIRGLPVVFDGRVFAAGNSDLVAAIDLRSGRRVWQRDVGSIHTPWIAGDYLYLLTNTPELVGFEAATGKILWVTPLQKWEDEEDRTGRIVWTGPVLASDRLIVASSEGVALTVSPYNGAFLGRLDLPDGVSIPPIVASNTLIFLTDNGDLIAYR